MSDAKKPIIGISSAGIHSLMLKGLMEQIEEAGGVPLFLGDPADQDAHRDIQKIDALVIMGNDDDLNPEDYGQQPHPRTQSEDLNPKGRARSDYEYAILAMARARKLPTYGICGGMQRINVFLGGSLHQHVPDLVQHDEHDQRAWDIPVSTPVEPIRFARESVLNDITQRRSMYMPAHGAQDVEVMENSCHHQAVDRLGNGVIASAFSVDRYEHEGHTRNIIEGIETDPNGPYTGWPMIGVQFHPEGKASNLGSGMASWITDQAIAYRQRPNVPPRDYTVAQALEENARHFAQHAAQQPVQAEIPRYTVESPKRLRDDHSRIAEIIAGQGV